MFIIGFKEIEQNSDLTKRVNITGNNELGMVSQAFDSLLNKLNQVFTNVVDAAKQVNASSQTFEDIFPKAGIEHFTHDGSLMSGGVVVIDYNRDGYDDFVLLGGDEEKTKIYRNNPAAYETTPYDYANMFTDVTDEIIDIPDTYFVIGGGSFDYDNDGWEDLFLTTDAGQLSLVYQNVSGEFKQAG
mgnify:FL=1